MSRRKIAPAEQGCFICGRCGAAVPSPEAGTAQRNHCPHCLWSRHVDLRIGDRLAACRGMMEPVGIWTKENGEWALIHRCTRCGVLRSNRIAGDDDELRLFALAAKPLTRLPFPYRMIERYEVPKEQ